ncbi:S-layer homology domain-containing protein [Paenibacillus sp. TAB 01]|uniref:S-layer homology domain-containing protein n=1 Tax=Paenibacillus sp. TAB 01 TaxID=3368988 RepID=UPI0037527683
MTTTQNRKNHPSTSSSPSTSAPAAEGGASSSEGGQSSSVSTESVQGSYEGRPAGIAVLSASALSPAIQSLSGSGAKLTIKVTGTSPVTVVQIPAESVAETLDQAPDAVISIEGNGMTYELPAAALQVQQWAASLGAQPQDMHVSIVIAKVSGPASDNFAAQAGKQDIKLLSDLVDFTITVEAGGKKTEVTDFGNHYLSRTFRLSGSIDSSKASGVIVNPATGAMTFVPTRFAAEGNETTVTIIRPGNSMYAVVQANKTFTDLKGHWAQADVELLASKLLVNGSTDTTFSPQNQITRAEFAALLVRAAGLTEVSTAGFSDVSERDWFAGAVGAAFKARLVDGFEDGTFQPNASISREQMAVMIVRALNLAGKQADADKGKLEAFKDSAQIAGWAQNAAAQAVNAGIVNGTSGTAFSPHGQATRAEAAVMLKRLLQYVQFMN